MASAESRVQAFVEPGVFFRFSLGYFSQMINVTLIGLQAVLILVFLVVFFVTNTANGG